MFPTEQMQWIQKIVNEEFGIDPMAIQITKSMLFLAKLEGGWKLFGKRGLWSSGLDDDIEWFVGWVEQGHLCFPCAYHICERQVDGGQMVLRA